MINRTHTLALGALLLAAVQAWCGEPAAPAPAAESAVADKGYDALFSEILQNLPEKDRAKVDSARGKGPDEPKPGDPDWVPPGEAVRQEKRAKALEKLAPDVKERVEKAIQKLESRQKERELEFKELDK
jgi:hypothetical protein